MTTPTLHLGNSIRIQSSLPWKSYVRQGNEFNTESYIVPGNWIDYRADHHIRRGVSEENLFITKITNRVCYLSFHYINGSRHLRWYPTQRRWNIHLVWFGKGRMRYYRGVLVQDCSYKHVLFDFGWSDLVGETECLGSWWSFGDRICQALSFRLFQFGTPTLRHCGIHGVVSLCSRSLQRKSS